MIDPAAPLPCSGSEHLELMVAEVDTLVRRLAVVVSAADATSGAVATGAASDAVAVGAGAVAEGTPVAARRAEEDADCAEATLRLDGGLRATSDGSGLERPGTWLDALGDTAAGDTPEDEADDLDGTTLEHLAELERAGVHAGITSDDLMLAFGRASSDAGGLGTALALLHARITAGLVADERAGRLRRGPRVVHDASVGRVLFFPTDPPLLPDAWDLLLRHLTGSGAGAAAARMPAAVRAGLLHLELLRHQPFDAANGRLARAAARLALLADGLLPAGLAAPDPVLAEDPLGYHEEVGASVRRRDATRWVERMLEAQGAALARSIAALTADGGHSEHGGDGADGAVLAADLAGDLDGDLEGDLTLADVVERFGGSAADARQRTSAWVVAGRAERVRGSSGLRLRLPGPARGR